MIYEFTFLQTDRLRNGEKASDFVWESWDTILTGSQEESSPRVSVSCSCDEQTAVKAKSSSLPASARMYTRSIPPSPTLEHRGNDVSITRSKSDEANVGKCCCMIRDVMAFGIHGI